MHQKELMASPGAPLFLPTHPHSHSSNYVGLWLVCGAAPPLDFALPLSLSVYSALLTFILWENEYSAVLHATVPLDHLSHLRLPAPLTICLCSALPGQPPYPHLAFPAGQPCATLYFLIMKLALPPAPTCAKGLAGEMSSELAGQGA